MQNQAAMMLYGFFVAIGLLLSAGSAALHEHGNVVTADRPPEARVDWQGIVASLGIVREDYPDAVEEHRSARVAALASLVDKRLAEARCAERMLPELVAKLAALSGVW